MSGVDDTVEPTGETVATSPAQRRQALVAGSVGNAVEWIDWGLYGVLAPVFAPAFFPGDDPVADLLAALVVFAVGFVMRPVGGAVIGAYTDRYGRRAGLTLTILLMSLSAFLLAVCPPYSVIGVAAPLVLVLARLMQGFSAGGEFGSSGALLVESATPLRRALAGSWQQVSAGFGLLVSVLLALALSAGLAPEAMASWGWRVAFAIGGVLGLLGFVVRARTTETESFRRAGAEGRVSAHPVRTLLREHPGAALRVIALSLAGVLIYYVWVNYMPSFVSGALRTLPATQALLANAIALAYLLCILPLAAMLADRVGRRPVLIGFAVGFLVLAYPAFRLLQDGGFGTLLLVEIAGMTLLAGYSANIVTVMAELFPAEVRTTGIGLPYAVSVAVFGGTAPYVTTWLATSGRAHLLWVYVAGAALVGLVAYLTMPETRDRTMD